MRHTERALRHDRQVDLTSIVSSIAVRAQPQGAEAVTRLQQLSIGPAAARAT